MYLFAQVVFVVTLLFSNICIAIADDDAEKARYDLIEQTQARIQTLERQMNEGTKGREEPLVEASGVENEALVESVEIAPDVPKPWIEAQKAEAIIEKEVIQDNGLRPEHAFEMGTEVSYITYKEPDVAVEESGPFAGLYAVYNFHPLEAVTWPVDVFHIDLHLNGGSVDYEGSGEIDDIGNYLLESRLWMGKDLKLSSMLRLTPYAGIGYRWLYDDSGGKVSTTGALGYDRQSQYLYVPIGGELMVTMPDGWRLSLNGEYDHLVEGKQTSYFSEFVGFADLENKQEKGYGIRGSIKLVKMASGVNYVIEPYIRYWHIQDSTVNTSVGSAFILSGYEPENTSTEIGGRLGMQF